MHHILLLILPILHAVTTWAFDWKALLFMGDARLSLYCLFYVVYFLWMRFQGVACVFLSAAFVFLVEVDPTAMLGAVIFAGGALSKVINSIALVTLGKGFNIEKIDIEKSYKAAPLAFVPFKLYSILAALCKIFMATLLLWSLLFYCLLNFYTSFNERAYVFAALMVPIFAASMVPILGAFAIGRGFYLCSAIICLGRAVFMLYFAIKNLPLAPTLYFFVSQDSLTLAYFNSFIFVYYPFLDSVLHLYTFIFNAHYIYICKKRLPK